MAKVLIVDDSSSQIELLTAYLREEGYTVISANDAKVALDKVVAEKPDVIVTDVVMPGMSGFELCRSLKKNPDTQDIPVVICTSKNQDLDKLWGLKQGANVYLTKPFTKEDIIQAVKSVSK